MEEKFMNEALKEARKAYEKLEIPVGAVIVKNGKIISRAHNLKETKQTATAHAEILAIQKANKKLNNWRLIDCDMYVTLEPCSMCKEVIKQTRIKKVYYLLSKPLEKKEYNKTEIQKSEDRKYEQMYANILSDFFKKRR